MPKSPIKWAVIQRLSGLRFELLAHDASSQPANAGLTPGPRTTRLSASRVRCASRFFERFHGREVWPWTMADPCNAMLCKYTKRWGSVADHDIEREGRGLSQTRDQSDIDQTRRE